MSERFDAVVRGMLDNRSNAYVEAMNGLLLKAKRAARGFKTAANCGYGWFDLLDVLCERLQFWTDHNSAPQAVAVQVKEKFGRLRFYI